MKRKEVQELTGLTRKAIEYYEEKELINPSRDENNYRIYSNSHVEILKKIKTLRKLGLSVEEITKIIRGEQESVGSILRNREIELGLEDKKFQLLEKLIKANDYISIEKELKLLEKEESIYTKLKERFPGYFGQLMFSSYKPFLKEKIADEKAFEEYLKFMDSLPPLNLTKEEVESVEKSTEVFSMEDLDLISNEKLKAVEDVEKWFNENQEMVKKYEEMKNSQEFKNSTIYKISEKIKTYFIENNYYEIAIPLIRKFSKSYDKYYMNSIKASEKFLKMLNND